MDKTDRRASWGPLCRTSKTAGLPSERLAQACSVSKWRRFGRTSQTFRTSRISSRKALLISCPGQRWLSAQTARPARSALPNPSRVQGRLPAGSQATVQRSERTTSHEDSCIRSTSDGPPTSLQPQQNRIVKMQSWSKITHYAGLDRAHDHHRNRIGQDLGGLSDRARGTRLAPGAGARLLGHWLVCGCKQDLFAQAQRSGFA
jgi:hypothetical protein